MQYNLKIVWGDSWENEYIFERNPYKYNEESINFFNHHINFENNLLVNSLRNHNLSELKSWDLELIADLDQKNILFDIYSFQSISNTNRYFRFYPDCSSSDYYKSMIMNKWENIPLNRRYKESDEKFIISLFIMQVRR